MLIEQALNYVNLLLIVSCAIMALIFFFLPVPKSKGLINYRVSLRLLAAAYLSLSILTIMDMAQGVQTINYPIALTATSLQSILFFFVLAILLNIRFARKKLVIKLLIPTLFYIFLVSVFAIILGPPSLHGVDDILHTYSHPVVILNMLFMLYCIVQLFILSYLLHLQIKKYIIRLNNYYANTNHLHLEWVRYLFLGAFIFAITIITSLIFNTAILSLIVTAINSLFYVIFGLFYIRYPLIYSKIEPIVNEPAVSTIEQKPEIRYRKSSWEKLKNKILKDKYYLKAELNIEQMAEYLKIGRTTLSNYINREEGINFYSWINQLRIEEAKQIIINNPDYSFARIAEMVGISEASNFSRQFKLVTKKSPSVWKSEYMKNAS